MRYVCMDTRSPAASNSVRDLLDVEEGRYPALNRMLLKGWLKAEWRISGHKPEGALLPAHQGRPETARFGSRSNSTS